MSAPIDVQRVVAAAIVAKFIHTYAFEDRIADARVASFDAWERMAYANEGKFAKSYLAEPDPAPLGWHVISGEDLLAMLRRVSEGEDPDMLYAEEYANAEHERIGDE